MWNPPFPIPRLTSSHRPLAKISPRSNSGCRVCPSPVQPPAHSTQSRRRPLRPPGRVRIIGGVEWRCCGRDKVPDTGGPPAAHSLERLGYWLPAASPRFSGIPGRRGVHLQRCARWPQHRHHSLRPVAHLIPDSNITWGRGVVVETWTRPIGPLGTTLTAAQPRRTIAASQRGPSCTPTRVRRLNNGWY